MTAAPDIVQLSEEAWSSRGWEPSASAMATGVELMLASRQWQQAIDRRLKDFELTFSRYEVLMKLLLVEPAACGVAELSGMLQVHATSVSNSLNRLEGTGYVEITPHRVDGRRLDVRLTTAGRVAAIAATGRLNREVFARLPLAADDVARLNRVLARFRANAGDF